MFNPEHIVYDFFTDKVSFFPDKNEQCPVVNKKWRRCHIDVEVNENDITIIRYPAFHTSENYFKHEQIFKDELPKSKERALNYLLAIVKSSIINPEFLLRTSQFEVQQAKMILLDNGKVKELKEAIAEAEAIRDAPLPEKNYNDRTERYKPYKKMQYTGD